MRVPFEPDPQAAGAAASARLRMRRYVVGKTPTIGFP